MRVADKPGVNVDLSKGSKFQPQANHTNEGGQPAKDRSFLDSQKKTKKNKSKRVKGNSPEKEKKTKKSP